MDENPKQRLEEIRTRLNATTPSPWAAATAPSLSDGRTKAQYQTDTLAHPDDERAPLWVVWAQDGSTDVDYVVPAITGDGPTSQANAEFIAHSKEDIAWLMKQLRLCVEYAKDVLSAEGK